MQNSTIKFIDGGYTLPSVDEAAQEAERIFTKYTRLAKRRGQKASALSGGGRRLLEISRSLIANPTLLVVDEPSIGLEPRYIDMIFEILSDLRDSEERTILMVEQNAKKRIILCRHRICISGRRIGISEQRR